MFEETVIRHCSPTLAGIKTANMFSCPYNSIDELYSQIRALNAKIVPEGIRAMPLRTQNNRALIYVYRPTSLKNDLESDEAMMILENCGYMCSTPERCIVKLISRLRSAGDFPHEIGLFLGYPPEDVKGFIENRAKHSKYCGLWKVYGDVEKAKILFDRYKKCTESYIKHWKNRTHYQAHRTL